MSRQGRVSREKNGTWTFVVDVSPAGAPRKQVRRRGFRTRGEAQETLTKLLGERQRGEFVAPDKLTCADWFDRWGESLELAPSTVKSYRLNLRLHVAPDLGAGRLQALTAADVDRCYARLRDEGKLSGRSRKYVHTILRHCLNDAVAKGLLVKNPTDRVTPPRGTRSPEMKTWTPAQLNTFLEHDAVRSDRLYGLLRLAGTTGARRGELAGLRWSDIEDDRMSIRRQVVGVDGKSTVTDVKTGNSRRSVALDPATVAVLRAHRKIQAEEKLACPGYRDGGYVFAGLDGSLLVPWHISRTFDDLVRTTGLPRMRFHDLRHSHATHLIASGTHAKTVSARLGHASVAFTLDKYGHVLEGMDEDAAANAAALVDGAGTT
jgi:integrase